MWLLAANDAGGNSGVMNRCRVNVSESSGERLRRDLVLVCGNWIGTGGTGAGAVEAMRK